MDDDELKILRAVVEEGGFGRAAPRVHLSQSAISQAIRRLEQEVGTVLLERGRPPVLTAAGRQVYEHAGLVLARRELLDRQLAALREGGEGVVAIAASQALSRELLPRLVTRFVALQPRASFQLETWPSREIITAVAEGRIELGLGPFARSMAGLVLHPLGEQRMVLYRGRRRAAQRRSGVAALRQETLVTSSLDSPAGQRRGLLREHFGRVWVVESLDLRLQLIAAGLAVGYLPESIVAASDERRRLDPLSALPFGAIQRTFGLFHSAQRTPGPMAERFLAMAHEFGSKQRSARRSRPA